MEPLPAPLIPHLLLPDWYEGPVVPDVRIQGRQRRAVEHEGRLMRRKVGFEVSTRPLVGHGAYRKAGVNEADMSCYSRFQLWGVCDSLVDWFYVYFGIQWSASRRKG